MGNTSNYVGAGLLSGFGRALGDVAGNRWSREKDEANFLRQQSIASYAADRTDARQANSQAFTTEQTDKRLVADKEAAGLLAGAKKEATADKVVANLDQAEFENQLKQETAALEYDLKTKLENFKSKNKGEEVADYKATMHRDTMRGIDEDFYKQFIESRQNLPEDQQNMADFMREFQGADGSTKSEPDFAKIELAMEQSGDPKQMAAVARRRRKRSIAEQLLKGGAWPEEAAAGAGLISQAEDTIAEKARKKKKIASIINKYPPEANVDEADVKKAMAMTPGKNLTEVLALPEAEKTKLLNLFDDVGNTAMIDAMRAKTSGSTTNPNIDPKTGLLKSREAWEDFE